MEYSSKWNTHIIKMNTHHGTLIFSSRCNSIVLYHPVLVSTIRSWFPVEWTHQNGTLILSKWNTHQKWNTHIIKREYSSWNTHIIKRKYSSWNTHHHKEHSYYQKEYSYYQKEYSSSLDICSPLGPAPSSSSCSGWEAFIQFKSGVSVERHSKKKQHSSKRNTYQTGTQRNTRETLLLFSQLL